MMMKMKRKKLLKIIQLEKKLICVIFHLQSAVAVCERIRAQSFFRGHREIQFAVVCDVTRLLFLPFHNNYITIHSHCMQ